MIDNPAYKGEWAPRKIANPNYFEDSNPVKSLIPIGGVGIELWSMTEDILFNNIYIGHSVEDARKLAEETYFVKKVVEEAAEKAAGKEAEAETAEVTFAANPTEFIRTKVFTFLELAKVDPVAAFKTHPETGAGLALAVVTLFGMLGVLLGGAQQKPITKVRVYAAEGDSLVADDYIGSLPSLPRRQTHPRPTTRKRRPHLLLPPVASRRRRLSRSGSKRDSYTSSSVAYLRRYVLRCMLFGKSLFHLLIYRACERTVRFRVTRGYNIFMLLIVRVARKYGRYGGVGCGYI